MKIEDFPDPFLPRIMYFLLPNTVLIIGVVRKYSDRSGSDSASVPPSSISIKGLVVLERFILIAFGGGRRLNKLWFLSLRPKRSISEGVRSAAFQTNSLNVGLNRRNSSRARSRTLNQKSHHRLDLCRNVNTLLA